MELNDAAAAFREFVAVIKALRTPGSGCPWDLEQTHQTLRPYLVEETYEVLDALDRGADADFREELGDLLLQIVLHAQVADDRAAFSIVDVVRGITAKMVRRHPHVFGSTPAKDVDEVRRNWDAIKAEERRAVGGEKVARVPLGLPALLRAQRVAEQTATDGGSDDLMDARQLGARLFELCRIAQRLGLSAEDALREHTAREEHSR